MCGIAGHVGRHPLGGARVDHALDLMEHRGPDNLAHRRWRTPDGRHIDLLHARLNIIDLEHRSDQPLRIGSKWIAYNGELYNYLELKEGLSQQGASFRTDSDTEVLLESVDRGGWETLDACEGMWAFAVYDEADGSLGLSRDRFGEKPLYLYRDDGDLYFGSEVKFIAAMLGNRLDVNQHHLHRYLVNGYKALYKGRRHVLRGVSELTPGTTLLVGPDGRERVHAYWDRAPQPQLEEMTRRRGR